MQALALVNAWAEGVREYGDALLHAAFCLDSLRVRSAPLTLTTSFTCNCEGLGVAVYPLIFLIRQRGAGARVAWKRAAFSGYPCLNPIASLLETLHVTASAQGASKAWRWCVLDGVQAITFFAAVFSLPTEYGARVQVGKGVCVRRGPDGRVRLK